MNHTETYIWRSHKFFFFIFGLILILSLLLRIVPLTYSHYWDETVLLQNAKVIQDGRTNYDEFDYRPPVLSLFFALGFYIWDSIYVANIVEGLLTTLVVLFGFLATRTLFGDKCALIAAFLFAFSPYFVNLSHQLLTGMPALAFMLCAIYLFWQKNKMPVFLSGVFYALAIETRFTCLFLVVYFFLSILAFPKKIKDSVYFLAGTVITLLPYLIWIQYQYGNFPYYPFIHARNMVTKWAAHVPLTMYFEGLLEIYTPLIIFGFVISIGMLVFQTRTELVKVRGFFIHKYNALTNESKHKLILLVWGTLFFVNISTLPHKEVKYLLPTAITVVILSDGGLNYVVKQWFRQTKIHKVIIGIILAVLLLFNYPAVFKKLGDSWVDDELHENVEIAQFLKQVSTEIDTIYAATEFPVIAFYSGRNTISVLPIQSDFENQWEQYMNKSGFFVYYEMDENFEDHSKFGVLKPDKKMLDKNPMFQKVKDFQHASVYRYDPMK